jgi:tetratricopeptide (TPR) repeat protein
MALGILAALVAGVQGAAPSAAPPPATGDEALPQTDAARRALEERLAQEKARLARLHGQLKQIQQGEREPDGKQDAEPGAAQPPQPVAEEKKGTEPDQSPALVRRPKLGAADVLYRLGRYEQARPIYEALAAQRQARTSDRIWALLQAGNCCRRLRDFDAALAHFQAILTDYPDNAWSKGHVAWALQTTQWEKRWHQAEIQNAEGGTRNAESPTPAPSSGSSTGE